jgi:hypothetical protein
MGGRGARLALFALSAAALVASALALALDGSSLRDTDPAAHRGGARVLRRHPRGEDAPRGRPLPRALLAGRRAVAAAARRFFAAFLSYEVGAVTHRVQTELRGSCTRGFWARLLAEPPRPVAAGLPGRARLAGTEVALLDGPAPRALVHATLRRGGRAEGFAILFQRRGRRWLAARVAG